MARPSPAGERGQATDRPVAAPISRAALSAALEGTLGYRVCTPEGRALGRLAWMRHGVRDGHVEALMVRRPGVGGLFSNRENPIPSELVETISHHQRRVVVRIESL